MILIDVNVLVYAHREDADRHPNFHAWLENLLKAPSAFGISQQVLSGFLRVVTHPKVFSTPSPLKTALEFANLLRNHPRAVMVGPGPSHWDIFETFCIECNAKGNLIADAYLAALAVEHGCEWITTDRDYARFRGLKWRHPLS
jgi:hypothetical protein